VGLSLEPFTLKKIGSPQVFQTGETFRQAPLTDYQHPHDLFMGLGADHTRTKGAVSYLVGADVVGSPTLGPTPFMDRVQDRTPPRHGWMFAFGQKREIHGNFEAYLFEATIKASTRGTVYTRAESVDKDILDAGFHPRGVFHRHRHSQVGAVTIGYLSNFLQRRAGTFGAGADVTGYSVPLNLQDSYGSPVSYHVFIHYSLRGQTTHAH